MDLQLKQQRIIVTGATSGLGYSVAELLIKEGAQVLAAGRDISRAPTGAAATLAVDLTEPSAPQTIIDHAADTLGGVDAVIAAAGRSVGGAFDQLSADDWDDGLSLNLLSVVHLCRAALPHLRRSHHGRIVLFGAVSGLEPRANHAISNVAKAGIHALTRSLSRELAPDQILVNCIAPGRIRSGQLDRGFPTEEARTAEAQKIVPLGRFGESDDSAGITALLASPANAYITGQIIAIDGGMSHGI